MKNLGSILKNRDIALLTKFCIIKAMIFPVVMYGCESWTIKKAECQRIDVFELWCWRRLLRVPWIAKRSNQSILKEINPKYSLAGLMLKMKLQSFGHLRQRADSLKRPWFWERLKVRGEGDDRGWDGWMASTTQWTWVWANSGRWWRTGKPSVLQSMGSQRVGHNWATEQQRNISKIIHVGCKEELLTVQRERIKRWYCLLGAPLVALVAKNPPAHAGDIRDMSSIPRSGRSPREGHGNPLQYSCL